MCVSNTKTLARITSCHHGLVLVSATIQMPPGCAAARSPCGFIGRYSWLFLFVDTLVCVSLFLCFWKVKLVNLAKASARCDIFRHQHSSAAQKLSDAIRSDFRAWRNVFEVIKLPVRMIWCISKHVSAILMAPSLIVMPRQFTILQDIWISPCFQLRRF